MAVLTADILIKGIRRDDVFDWLGDVNNHAGILEGAWDGVEGKGLGSFEITLKTPGKSRVMTYDYDRTDDSHGGRRVFVNTGGKRTRGQLSYSLRTMKPSTNTMVTLHIDYDPGSMLGQVINNSGLSDSLLGGMKTVLDNIERVIPRG